MKKSIGLLVLCVLIVLMAACGPSRGSQGSDAKISTLDRIKESGKLRVGTSLGGPPIAFRDDSGKPRGYDVDWAEKMAELLGVEVEWVEVDGDTRITSLIAGRVDVVFNNITGNLARAQRINFSIPYLQCGIKMLVRAGLPYKKIEDLNDPRVKVVVGRGTTGEELVLAYAPKAQIVNVPNFTDSVLQLQTGKADASFEDNTIVDYAAKQSGGVLVAPEGLYSSDPICIGLPKGDLEYVRWVDMFVSWMITQGWQAEIYEKWWGEPPAPLKSLW